MKPTIMLLLAAISLSPAISAQDLTGHWQGSLPQDDKSFTWEMQSDIIQEGNKITGTNRYDNPTNDDFVIERFSGIVKRKKIHIQEYEIVEQYLSPSSTYGWCVKTMEGVLIDGKTDQPIIQGNWYSQKVWFKEEQAILDGICPPGSFQLVKYNPKETISYTMDTKIRLEKVFFAQTEASILPASYPELDKLSIYLNANPTLKIRLEGHTDRIGNREKNQILSEKRAEAIKRYLEGRGIHENRISTVGFGETQIICDPPCKENRRVEFVLSLR